VECWRVWDCPLRDPQPLIGLCEHALSLQARLDRAVERARDLPRSDAFLARDRFRQLGRRRIPGTLGHPLQELVAGDLQMLEREGEPGQLAGRVGLSLEERAPVERAEPHGGVLDARGRSVQGLEALRNALLMYARLLQVLLEKVGEL